MEENTPTLEEVITELVKIVCSKTEDEPSKVDLDDALENLGLDSLEVLDLIFTAEHKFKIRFPKTLDDVKTLRDVANVTYQLILDKK